MDDRNRSSSSDREEGLSGSPGRPGSKEDLRQGGRGIRDDASPGEGSAGGQGGSQSGGMRAPSGSDELDDDVSRTGKSGAGGLGGNAGSMGSGAGGMGGYGGSGTGGNSGPQGMPKQ